MPSDNTDSASEDAPLAESQLDGSHTVPLAEQQPFKRAKSTSAVVNEHPSASKEQHGPRKKRSIGDWFAIPPPLKRLFDKFPLVTYAENATPILASRRRDENTLYIFTTHEDAAQGRASFNPSCLKWQTYLKMAGIPFKTVVSNNHASPGGSLPFLFVAPAKGKSLPEQSESLSVPELMHGARLKRWIHERRAQGKVLENVNVRSEAYTSLLDNAIRKAWLYQLYLNSRNASVVKRLYTEPCSLNPLVQITIASQLRAAATAEIVKASAQTSQWIRIDETRLMRDADEAFAALSMLLADTEWFFSPTEDRQTDEKQQAGPSLFDASVFAYTHLLLDSRGENENSTMHWVENPLGALLEKYINLTRHHDRIVELYY